MRVSSVLSLLPRLYPQFTQRDPVYPLTHTGIPKTYPQMWIASRRISANSPCLAGKLHSRDELHVCKLPTLWISPVDKKGPDIMDVEAFS
jgi:hypothetical protein